MARTFDTDRISQRLKVISEYSYYNPTLNEAPEDEEQPVDDGLEAGDDLENDLDTTVTDDSTKPATDNLDAGGEDLEDDLSTDGTTPTTGDGTDPLAANTPVDGTTPIEDPLTDTGEEEVEVDVSQIVDGVDQNTQNMKSMDSKLDSMESQMSQYINQIIQANKSLESKISQLEKNMNQELIKRAPTPNEQIQMRSMSSYPYNQPLTSFWKRADNEDEYSHSIENTKDNLGNLKLSSHSNEDKKPREYTLTDKDVMDDYNQTDIRGSL